MIKINGILLGSAVFLTGMSIKNYELYTKESITGTLILSIICLILWHFSIDNVELKTLKEQSK